MALPQLQATTFHVYRNQVEKPLHLPHIRKHFQEEILWPFTNALELIEVEVGQGGIGEIKSQHRVFRLVPCRRHGGAAYAPMWNFHYSDLRALSSRPRDPTLGASYSK